MTWPRLTDDLVGPRSPDRCQGCGAYARLTRWQEHDDADKPEPRVVVLCERCSGRLIEPHPRLYAALDPDAPVPGAMPLCLDCRFRAGVRCLHPDLKANGGPGLEILPLPLRVLVCRSPRRLSGWETIYPGPPLACQGRETSRVVHDPHLLTSEDPCP